MVKRPESPCDRNCPNREIACAVTCPAWAKYEKERNNYYKESFAENNANHYVRKAGRRS